MLLQACGLLVSAVSALLNVSGSYAKQFWMSFVLRIRKTCQPSHSGEGFGLKCSKLEFDFFWNNSSSFATSEQWRDWRGAGVRAAPPWQTKCKKWAPLLASISLFGILLIFTRFLFSAFFKNILEYFPFISVVSTNESRHLRCPAFYLVKMQGILNRMTNLPRFLCVFNWHMQLSVS